MDDMYCVLLQNDDPRWISCNEPAISATEWCQSFTENLFDIEVLDDQGRQISQFEGSAQGTTIQNLNPGTYITNETKVPNSQAAFDVLYEDSATQDNCIAAGFVGGGYLEHTDATSSDICFEYEDEQGNDCSTLTLTAGEEKTCTVKNYIRHGQ